MATPYVKNTWVDNDPTKPFSAARLGVMENGIFDAHYRPSVSVYNTSAINVAGSTVTGMTFDSELYDYSTPMHSTSSNTGRLIAPVDAKYTICARIAFAPNATGYRTLILRLNGVTAIDEDAINTPDASASACLQIARDYPLDAGDYVDLVAFQTSGGGLLTVATVALSHFSMHLASY